MQLKFDARARRILRRLPAVNVYSLLELAVIAALAIQAARLVWAVVTPVSPLGDWRPAGLVVPGSPGDVIAGFDPFFRLEGAAAASAPSTVTSLQLTLFGIRVDEASGRGSAIIAGPDGQQNSFSVGDEVASGVTLKSVAFDHVVLDRGGADENLYIVQGDGAAPPPPPGAGESVVALPAMSPPQPVPPPPAPSSGAGVPIGQLRSEIGMIPRLDNGRISGLVVRPSGTGAVFRQAGLREGDTITSIGGRPVTGSGDIERVSKDFANGGSIPITVERGDATLPLSITIAPTK